MNRMNVPPDSTPATPELLAEILKSRKYASLCEHTIERIGLRELSKRKSFKEAVKATKRKLHQLYGAFNVAMDYDAVIASLVEARNSGSGEAFREVVTCLLNQHASTKERLPILGEFYSRIWDRIGPPKRILDLACGLAPVAFPWMGLDSDVYYYGYDIDRERIRFLNRFFELVELRPLATVQDVIAETPKESADVAFLLKAVSSFERDEKGSSIRILRELNVENIVVSFPVKSLGGRSKGMEQNYAKLIHDMVAGERWRVEEIPFETEQVFLLRAASQDRIGGTYCDTVGGLCETVTEREENSE